MKFQMSLADEAKEIIKMAGTSSKSSKLDKAINTQVQELLNLIKSNAEINGMDLQPEDYLHIRTYRSSIRKAIQDIDNPGHDLSQKKERNQCSRDGTASQDQGSIIEAYGHELANDF